MDLGGAALQHGERVGAHGAAMLPVAPRRTAGPGVRFPGMRRVRGPVALVGLLAAVATGCSLPNLDDYAERPLAQTTFLYAADGSLITELHETEDRVVLT